ncbi:MAG: TIGR00282 family metallophosphoesterase [Deltaproteobacteria bacterium]|nr:TIGR00282 family metallophosphoesterase [Deltaproteobacteria bacterium]MBI5902631.1 TIGR00282 family metallophosphoesterase [Deltaproteobacteria bacterium]
MSGNTKILFIGDIIGRPGRNAVRELLPGLINRHVPDIVIANGENAAGGFGITPEVALELKRLEIDVITTGNHVWDKKEIYDYIKKEGSLLRPANYPAGAPGCGWGVFKSATGVKVGVLNLLGRVFMESVECPFKTALAAVGRIREETTVIVVDMHAETTSEKAAMGWYLDGQVSAVIGTHTHVQTSDERVLPNGTAFITDAGMTGPTDSVIGMRKESIIERFISQMPVKFDVAVRGVELQGVVITVGADGRARSIERLKVPFENV